MRGPFVEEIQAEHLDPLESHGADPFPFEEVFARLDQEAPRPAEQDLAEALKAIIAWMVDTPVNGPRSLRVIGQRTIALAWVLDPRLMQGRSLSQIAKAVGISPDSLQRLSGDVSRRFGIRNRGQAHAANWRRGANTRPSAKIRDAKESFTDAKRRAGPNSQGITQNPPKNPKVP